jgi:2-C-methyl-D-erythritol 4-phosphate cytidylyltransferase
LRFRPIRPEQGQGQRGQACAARPLKREIQQLTGKPIPSPKTAPSAGTQAPPRIAALVVAAGRGQRFGSELPKQYVPLAGPCAFHRSVRAFLDVPRIGLVCPVIHPDDTALCAESLSGLHDPRLLAPVPGGATRGRSVRQGLESLVTHAPDLVLIHDAARPFVSAEVIGDVCDALADTEGACAALPVVDALWMAADGLAVAPVPRDGLWRAQTPQGFRFDRILAAHRAGDGGAADDVAVARAFGIAVRLVPGSERNYKITLPSDLERALNDVAAMRVGERTSEGRK